MNILLKITIGANEANQRLDRFLRKYMKERSLTDIYRMIRKKDVIVNGKGVRENYRLKCGDLLEIYASHVDAVTAVKPADREFETVYEDDNILIVDKPPGLILHPDSKHHENTLVDQVIYYLCETGSYRTKNENTFKPAAVNRLDVNTGGIVMFAKNYESLQNMSYIIRNRLAGKYYICVVSGSIHDEMDIKAFLTKDDKANKAAISYEESEKSKAIRTIIKPLYCRRDFTLVEINLVTGRSHQIRAQLSKLGCPIIGDVKYGRRDVNDYFREKYNLKWQMLYAYKVKFHEAWGNLEYLKGRTFTCRLPDVYNKIINELFGCNVI